MKLNNPLLLLLLALFTGQTVVAQPCLSGWQYRVPVYVDNSSGSSVNDYQTSISLNSQALIATGKMSANAADIRVLTKTGAVLPHWVDHTTLNSTNTQIWFKTNLNATALDTVYLFYGNTSAVDISSGTSVFSVFDDFDQTSINTSIWNTCINGSASLTNGNLELLSPSGGKNTLVSVASFSSSAITEVYINSIDNGRALIGVGSFSGSPSGFVAAIDEPGAAVFNNRVQKLTSSTPCFGSSNLNAPNNTGTVVSGGSGIYGLAWPANGNVEYMHPGGSISISSSEVSQSASVNLVVGLMDENNGIVSIDWVRARKYASNPPAISLAAETSTTIIANITSNGPICENTSLTVSANGPIGAVYSWSGPNGFTANTDSATVSSASLAASGNYSVTINQSGGCASLTETISVVVTPVSVGGTTSGAASVCASNNSGNITLAGETGSVLRWESSTTGNAPWTSISETSSTLSYQNLASSNWLRAIVQNGSCAEAASSATKITVNSASNGGILLGSATVCDGTNTGTLQLIGTTDSIVTWERSTDGGSNWTNLNQYAATLNYSNVSATSWYRILVQNGNCASVYSDTAVLTLAPLPTVDFDADTACLGTATTLTNQSTISSGSLSLFNWDFGDGSSSSANNANKNFSGFGNQNVTLTATSALGCSDSNTKSVYVAPNPTVNFSTASECLSDSVSFETQSSIALGSVAQHSWDFGDGNVSSLPDAKHLYMAAADYTITYTTTSDLGCSTSSTQTISVYPEPNASFVHDTIYTDQSTSFVNTSSISNGNLSYNWNFGDGSLSTLTNPSHTFADSGSYSISLLTQSSFGCTDTVFEHVILPKAHFSANEVCFGEATFFQNQSAVPIGTLSYEWTFGDGATSTQTNPSHTYSSAGTYTARLVAISNQDHKSVFDSTIVVKALPNPDFSFSHTCDTVAMAFSNNSSPLSTSSYEWTFGSEGTSTLQNPSFLFSSNGTYNVKLKATANQCSDSITKAVTVFPRPVANFDYTIMCNGESTPFTNSSSISNGNIASYSWTFGDGASASASNPSHQYNTQGVYTTTLIATSDSGCLSEISKNIKHFETPSLALSSNSPVCEGSSINLSVSGLAGADYTWSGPTGFSDTVASSNIMNASLNAGGTYVATATNSSGCAYYDSIDIVIDSASVGGNVLGATTVCINQNTGTLQLTGRRGSVIRWESSNTGTAPWATINNITDSLIFSNLTTSTWFRAVVKKGACMAEVSNSAKVKVDAASNGGLLLGSDDICQNQNGGTLQLVNTSDSILNWEVSTNGGNSWAFINQQSNTYTYANIADSSTFRVRVQNGVCQDTVSTAANMNVLALPQPSFEADTICLGSITSFTNTSVLFNGQTSSYSWSFGDGSGSSIENPSHAYSTSGSKQTTLTAVTNQGCTSSITNTAMVNANPVSQFQLSNVCQADSAQFVNQSFIISGSITQSDWSFGDGNTSSLSDPTHGFATAGNYTVTLTSTSAAGCVSSSSQTITIHPMPTAQFTFDTVAVGVSTPFTNNSSVSTGNLFYTWSFGDGASSTTQNPNHEYASGGSYVASLLVNTAFGCTDTFVDSVYVVDVPVASFVASEECLTDSTVFTNQSTVAVGALSYQWHFGDGAQSTNENPKHLYANPGIYSVQLVVTSIYGITDQINKTVKVNPNPIAGFYFNETCDTIAVKLENTSYITQGQVQYLWHFGDDDTSSIFDPSHLYDSSGIYTVRLIATSNFGCADSHIQNLTVHPRPEVDFSNDVVCIGGETGFYNESTISLGIIDSYLWDFGDEVNSIVENPSHQYDSNGLYNVMLTTTSDFGCKSSFSKTAQVFEMPYVDFDFENVCFGAAIPFKNQSSIQQSVLSYEWNYGNGLSTMVQDENYSYEVSGQYLVQLIATSDDGCIDSVSKSVIVYALPEPMILAEEKILSKGYTTTLFATGGSYYAWAPEVSAESPFAQSTVIRPFESTEYELSVLDSNGCEADTSIFIEVLNDYKLEATNVLTPDNNGKNDFWIIQNIDAYSNATLIILDRWGNTVFEQKAYKNNWGGTNTAGEPLTDGTYYYIVTFEGSDKVYKGAVTILRNDS
jgi:gliding motility-associated-like protein